MTKQKHSRAHINALSAVVNATLASSMGRPRTILDIGCGTGEAGALARARGARVVGIETDVVKANQARNLIDEVLEWDTRSDKGIDKALRDRTFDLITISETANLPRPKEIIEHLVHFLVPEGHMLVTVRNKDSELATMKGWIKSAGLEILRVEHDPGILAAAPFSAPFLRPLESLVAELSPSTLAQRHVIVARRAPKPGPLSLTIGMLTMNEEESIARMIEEIRKYAPDANIVCVDSSTKDKTHIIAEQMGATVIRQLPPRGHGPAMEVLMYEAAKKTDALIYLDCDFTYPTDSIPEIRRLLEEGIDVVNGSRTWKKPKAMPLPNYLANRTFAVAAQIVSGVSTRDIHSGMRGYRCSVIRAFDFSGEGDAIPIDTLLWPAKCGYRVLEVPIAYHDRVGDSKLRKIAGTAWTFIRLAKSVGVGAWNPKRYERRKPH